MFRNSNGRWDYLLPARNFTDDGGAETAHLTEKTILLTGAAGSIGSALAQKLLCARPRELLLLDHSEQALYALGQTLSHLGITAPFQLLPSAVGNLSLLKALLEAYSPDLIVHAAAYKHVALMEANPFAAVQNNAILTWQLAKTASEHGVPQLLLISTDKAANPRGIMGASKRLAEQVVIRWSASSPHYSATRLVNVLGSTGSVLPLFADQIDRGGPLTISAPDAARYFLTMDDTVRLIVAATALPDGGAVYVPTLSDPVRITDLAKELLRHTPAAVDTIRVEYSGLRPGEKLSEDILARGEATEPTQHPALLKVIAPRILADDFDGAVHELNEIVQRRDLPALVQKMCQQISDYEPSSTLCLREVSK